MQKREAPIRPFTSGARCTQRGQPERRVHRLAFVLVGLCLFVIAGCNHARGCRTKTDAERAEEERREADEAWRSSYALLPWRALKGAARSRGAENRPAIYVEVDRTLDALAAPSGDDRGREARDKTEAAVKLLTYLVVHKSELAKHDEDEFPRLANLWTGTTPPRPFEWYDNGAEHLVTAFVVLVLDAVDKGNRVPAGDVVFYELARAETKDAWPREVRVLGRYARGLTYGVHAYHYAADEELTEYLGEVEGAAPSEYRLLDTFVPPPERLDGDASAPPESPAMGGTVAADAGVDPAVAMRESLRAVGYFTRAWNRLKLDRRELATSDTEEGLKSLERLGIENELTLWGWALVHQQRGRYEQSADALDKLALSPYLDEDAKREVHAAAADVRKHGSDPGFFHKQRTSLAILKALVARGGGFEQLAVVILGAERTRQILAPILLLAAAREYLRDATNEARGRASEFASGATESGKGFVSEWREKIFGRPSKPAAP